MKTIWKKAITWALAVMMFGTMSLSISAAGTTNDTTKTTNPPNVDPYYWYLYSKMSENGSLDMYNSYIESLNNFDMQYPEGYQSSNVYIEDKETYQWFEYPKTAGKYAGKRFCLKNGVRIIGFAIIDGKAYCFDNDGFMVKSRFAWHNGKRYYFGKNGYALEGWYDINKQRYYFKEGGAAATGVVSINGTIYMFDSNGKLIKGKNQFVRYKTSVYYVDKSGIVATGWRKLNGDYYYFRENGKMVIDDIVECNGRYCSFDKTGKYVGAAELWDD